MTTPTAVAINGTLDARFQKMSDLLAETIENGKDLGASVAVTIDGKPVVDIWAGWANPEKTSPWERDTITNVWSSTKTVTSLCALVLASRGELDVHAKVAKYWPDFAQNGKENIEVRHLMSHTSGVSAWAQPVVVEDIYDWEKSTAMLARQAPWWEPGTASGYHALNQGHLVGEVIRRISGKSLGTFLKDEVAGPLAADFHIGLPESEFGRVSNVVPPPPMEFGGGGLAPDSVAGLTFSGPAPQAEAAWTLAWRKAEIGAANGHGNARSIARLQSVIACGGEVDGIRLLTPEVIESIFEEQANGVDLVLGTPVRFGIGFGLPSEAIPHVPRDGKICYWGGWGGSQIIIDLDHRMTIAYMMNRMDAGVMGDDRAARLIAAAYTAIGA